MTFTIKKKSERKGRREEEIYYRGDMTSSNISTKYIASDAYKLHASTLYTRLCIESKAGRAETLYFSNSPLKLSTGQTLPPQILTRAHA